MITVTNIRNIDHTAYDEVWAIVRSFKNPGNLKHVPELSPSWNLFRQYLPVTEHWKVENRGTPGHLCSNIFKGDADCNGQEDAQRICLAGQAWRVYRFSLFLLRRSYMPQEHRRRHPSARWDSEFKV